MGCKDPRKFSKEDLETINHLAVLLHLFYHRNNNQHRRSIWWRPFSIFRRQVNGLNDELKKLNETPLTHLERTRKKSQDPQTRATIEARLSYWQTILVPKWQQSFSQVVADGRFAMLGLVLIAILSEICRITGITATLEDLGQAEVEKALEAFARDGWENDETPAGEDSKMHEDFGEVISREVEVSDEDEEGSTEESQPVQKKQKVHQVTPAEKKWARMTAKRERKAGLKPPKEKKKKKKKGNAIDDLFSGF